jgi:predicted Fe-Mo cluster-binding NifX family protein
MEITMKTDAVIKIAAITDDGQTISQHFGRSPFYLVVTVENGQVTQREMREKLGHGHFSGGPHGEEHSQPHGFGPEAQDRHARMASAISDCEALLCRGMGAGAYESMKMLGIRPIVTDLISIEEAVQAYLEGSIVDRIDRLH